MTMLGALTFTGASKTVYLFDLFHWGDDFDPAGAVYLILNRQRKEGGGHTHELILVGQTSALSSGSGAHLKADCLREHIPNCIGVLLEDNRERRLAIERDLIESYHPPCNR